jgi:hypothetical protein
MEGKAGKFDAEAAGGCGGDVAGLERNSEGGGGELVWGVGGAAYAEDLDAIAKGRGAGGADFARDGNEMEQGLRTGKRTEGEEKCANAIGVDASDCTEDPVLSCCGPIYRIKHPVSLLLAKFSVSTAGPSSTLRFGMTILLEKWTLWFVCFQ